MALRHRGNPEQLKNGPRRLLRITMGRPHLSQPTPASLGLGFSTKRPSGIGLVALHFGYALHPKNERPRENFTAIGELHLVAGFLDLFGLDLFERVSQFIRWKRGVALGITLASQKRSHSTLPNSGVRCQHGFCRPTTMRMLRPCERN